MSGRTREILYRIITAVLVLATAAGTVLIALRGGRLVEENAWYYLSFGLALLSLFLLPINALIHELGHLLFGFSAGMKFSSVRFSRLRIFRAGKRLRARFIKRNEVVGSCEMFPKNAKRMRLKTIVYALGGATANFLYAIAFLLCFFLLPAHPVLFFFQLFVPMNLFEGLMSLYPIATATGKTDGLLVRDLIKGDAEAIVTLRVLTAQGHLHRATLDRIDESLLFDVPVVREDEPSYCALLQLQYAYLFFRKRDEEGMGKLNRMRTLYDELPDLIRADVACDFVYALSAIANEREAAEIYVAQAQEVGDVCAYHRAMAAFCAEEDERLLHFNRASALLKEEPLLGVAEMERAYLNRLSEK